MERRTPAFVTVPGHRTHRGNRQAHRGIQPPAVVVVHALAHGMVPPVVASVVTKVGDFEAGEEDGRDDEQDPGDDHNPRREPVEPIRFNRHGRWLGGDGGRPGWDFRCFTHT